MNRYSRHIALGEIGRAGQDKLAKARVLVVGAGGLGCPVLQYLTAAGIGALGIVDPDIIEESNLQRQILFGTATLGQNKALAAQKRLTDLNPNIDIRAYPERLTPRNALAFCRDWDVVVDGTDNLGSRYLINDASLIAGKPLVYAAVYKFEGQLAVFNYRNGPSYRCLYPTPPRTAAVPDCSESGVLGVLPGLMGVMQANEVLKSILNLGTVLSGKVLFYNALSAKVTTVTLHRSEVEIDKALANSAAFQPGSPGLYGGPPVDEISVESAFRKRGAQWIDIREMGECPRVKRPAVARIPFSQLMGRIDEIDSQREKIIFCQTGARSQKAVALLSQRSYFDNCYSVKGGAWAISAYEKKQRDGQA